MHDNNDYISQERPHKSFTFFPPKVQNVGQCLACHLDELDIDASLVYYKILSRKESDIPIQAL